LQKFSEFDAVGDDYNGHALFGIYFDEQPRDLFRTGAVQGAGRFVG
jgi:hypothetical protein